MRGSRSDRPSRLSSVALVFSPAAPNDNHEGRSLRGWQLYEYAMTAIVLAASILRVALISQHWPVTNSDEGVMDLMALHIANRGEHPIFFYGQEYMGPLEAYIGAGLFQIFGASVFALRLGVIPFFAFFLLCMYFLTRLLYTRRLALITIILLSLGSSDIVTRQLKAIGGYPETFFFAAAIFLLASKLALSSRPAAPKLSERERRTRWLLYGLLGCIVGLALWIDQLILPFIATTGLLLLLFCRRELFSYAGLCALLGIVLGALPLIYYNLTSPLDHNSLIVLVNLQRSGVDELATRHIPRIQQLVGAFFISLPAITSLNPLCDTINFPLFGRVTGQNVHCTLVQGGWALGYTLLWIWAAALAGYGAWISFSRAILSTSKDIQHRDSTLDASTSSPTVFSLHRFFQRIFARQNIWPYAERQECIKHCARLLLLVSAALSFVLYATSPGAALAPATNTRYLICMLVALPTVLWPLWCAPSIYKKGIIEKQKLFSFLLRGGILLLIAAMFISGTGRVLADIPNGQATYTRQQALIEHLEHLEATRIYTDYWTCYRLAFQSNERIICAPLTEDLKRGPESINRYAPYYEQVQTASQPTYVFPKESIQAANFAHQAQARSKRYTYSEFGDYVIYHYTAPIGIP
ncbi:MAG: hypothetical protein H0U76_05655 [Ktedonobacteraceae bacterium]|nr:hypothetical protein [Ktedonobacteraceae bacterium]